MNFKALDEFLEHLLDMGYPMYDCTVHVNREEVYRRQGGYIDVAAKRRHIPDTKYFLYSVSKPVTCAAALTLFEKGKFLLSDPVSMYLPEFADVQVAERLPDGRTFLRPAKRPIRIVHLFTMTAGLNYNLGSDAIREAVAATDGRAPTREIVRAISKEPLSFDPGDRWQYSLCHDVLAGLVEVIAGERFSDYVKRVIFDPLGMKNSGYRIPEGDAASQMATQYVFEDNFTKLSLFPSNGYILGPEYDSGGAGMISTAEDYIRFADMMSCGGTASDGTPILAQTTIDLMRTNFLTDAQLASFNWQQMAGYGYGLGVRTMIDRAQGGSLSPLGEFGWGGAAGALAYFDPSTKTAIYLAQHTRNPREEYVLPRLRNVVYASLGR